MIPITGNIFCVVINEKSRYNDVGSIKVTLFQKKYRKRNSIKVLTFTFNRLLEEEFQKREELERLQQQQEEMLKAEREQKAVLEGDRKEQERLLAEAKRRLEELELERLAAEDKMQVGFSKELGNRSIWNFHLKEILDVLVHVGTIGFSGLCFYFTMFAIAYIPVSYHCFSIIKKFPFL